MLEFPSKVSKSKEFQRPCDRCRYFQWLTPKYGVCRKHEAPSKPRSCDVFKHKIA